MIILEVIALLVILAIVLPEPVKKVTAEEMANAERDQILAQADILSRKARYENKSFATRIHAMVDRTFESFKIIDNLILMDEKGVEHQIPLLCATTKGVILFQTVDYPGKGLFGNMDDEEWQIAQSVEIAQVVPNAAMLAIENAMLIKRLTGINVKPIAVVSKYTPMVGALNSYEMGQRLITEEELQRELSQMHAYGKQFYPDEFMIQVKQKLLDMNVADEDEDDDEDEIPAEEIPAEETSEESPVPATT